MLKQEKILVKFSLILALIGILIIVLISNKISTEENKISALSENDIGKEISLKGKITDLNDTPSILILEISDKSGKIKVIIFKDEDIELKENSIVLINGVLKYYNSELQIEASKIKVF